MLPATDTMSHMPAAANSSAPLRFVDFVHMPSEAAAFAKALSVRVGHPIEVVAVPGDISAPSDERAAAMFAGGEADFGCL